MAISYLSEGEWLSLTQPWTPKFFLLINVPLYNSVAIIGAVVAVVLVIAVMITAIVIIVAVGVWPLRILKSMYI